MGVQTYRQPDVAIPSDAEVGEGPVFDGRTGRLCWVDITRGLLIECDLTTGTLLSTRFNTMLGAIAPRASEPGFAAAVSDGFALVDGSDLVIAHRVLPEPHRRMNDAKCDSAGRLWAGSTHVDFLPGAGALHRWDGDGPSTLIESGFTLPNGMGWSPDNRTMYLIDSFANALLRADYDLDDGAVGEFTALAHVDAGFPDGLSVDAEGFIWVAIWDGSEVRRYNPAGEVVAIVPLPVSRPSSCAFGDDGTLYITSARLGLTPEALAAEPHAGSVFALASGHLGAPVAAFRR